MTAIAEILQVLEFSIPSLVPSFIKLDFSELPALITSFAIGPLWGILVCFLKNLIHILFGSSMAVGELSNFILGAVFVLVAGLIYKRHKTAKTALVACLIGSLAMAVCSVFSNYFLIYPLYGKVLGLSTDAIVDMYSALLPSVDNLWKALLIFNLPFTFVKGIIDSALCFLIYKKISPVIKKNT